MATLNREQILKLVEKIKTDENVRKQFVSSLDSQSASSIQDIFQRIGLPATGLPITKGAYEKGVGAAITETAPKAQREAVEFQQEQAERERGRGGILPRAGLEGLQRAPIEEFREVPTGVSPTGAIETGIEPTPEAKLAEQEILASAEREEKIKQAVIVEQNKLSDAVGELQVIEGDIESLLDTFGNIPAGAKGPVEARLKAPFRFFQTGGTEQAVEYEDVKQFFLSNISRRLGGERGVLTDKDIERVEGFLPRITDSDPVAENKTNRVREFVRRRIDEHRERVRTKINRIRQGNIPEDLSGIKGIESQQQSITADIFDDLL